MEQTVTSSALLLSAPALTDQLAVSFDIVPSVVTDSLGQPTLSNFLYLVGSVVPSGAGLKAPPISLSMCVDGACYSDGHHSSGEFNSVRLDWQGQSGVVYSLVTVMMGQGPATPEPSTWALLAIGLSVMITLVNRSTNRSSQHIYVRESAPVPGLAIRNGPASS